MSSSSFDPSLLDAKAEEAPQTHSTELRGLTSAQVEERISQGKINLNTDLKTKSIKELFIENLCTLFNLINLVLSILVLVTGAFKNLTFLGVVFLNTAIGVVQSVRSKRMVDKLTLLATKRVVAIRDGKTSAERIARGDVRARLQEVSGFAEETHDEYAILDRAGRLQIPREMLEAAGVTGNQVRLEMQDGRIVLTAPEEQRDA